MVIITDDDQIVDLDQEDPGCQCCCCTGECASQGYELEDDLSLGLVEGEYDWC